jgi:Tol biopolymer transport system component
MLEPTWSPDGRFTAYTSDRGGKLDVWVQQLSGGDAVQVTHGPGNNCHIV